ncbi:MAG: hypothetical protein ABFS30_12585 [Pseudomonadota bacterium]
MFRSSRLCAIALGNLAALAAAPALAQETEEPRARKENCLEVSLDGDYKFKIPCPQGTRPLLEKLPRPAEPAPRRDIVIDPEWPHDQAMLAEHDWPHDWAMIAPQADDREEAIPLFDGLFGAIEQDMRESRVRQLLEDWLPGKSK